MDRKKMLILIFALVVLVGGIFVIVRSINNRNQNNSSNQTLNAKSNMFGQDSSAAKENTMTDVAGTVEVIAEKTLTIKGQELSVVNINGSTPVMITAGASQPVAGQMADLKVGDSVKVSYDKITKNAIIISVAKTPVVEKKK